MLYTFYPTSQSHLWVTPSGAVVTELVSAELVSGTFYIMTFDTSAIGLDNVDSATLSVYGVSVNGGLNIDPNDKALRKACLDYRRLGPTSAVVMYLEREGIDYCYVEKSDFEKLIKEDKFIEYAEYCGHLYGTPVGPIREAINNKKILILAIDVQGALQIMKKMPEAISIFITAPDDKTLKLRLKNRLTDDDVAINKRFIVAKEEMEYSKYYDYCVINDRLDDAVKEIEGILNLS